VKRKQFKSKKHLDFEYSKSNHQIAIE